MTACYICTDVWFGLVLWHINYFRLWNAKLPLYIYYFTCTCIGFHPGRVEPAYSRASNMLLIEEDTLGFDWGKGPKSYPEDQLAYRRFSTDALREWPKANERLNRHLLDFHPSSFSWVAALITLGARHIHLGWPYQEPKFLTAWLWHYPLPPSSHVEEGLDFRDSLYIYWIYMICKHIWLTF